VPTTGRTLIDPPVIRPAPYGLYSVAQVTDDGGNGERWEAGGTEYTSIACAQGTVWAVGCGPAFSVTVTKTATANQWSADFTPNVGPYEISIDGGAYAPIVEGGTFVTASAGATVTVRETTGLRRQITLANVSNVAATSTAISGSSGTSAFNDAKSGVGVSFVQADPFIVIAGVACGMGRIGDTARAAASLAAAEPRLVERTFERGNITPALVSAATVTPNGSTAVSVKRAIGLLETYLRANYGGTGVMHAAPILAEYMKPEVKGNQLLTRLGTPIAFGSGYTGPNPTTGAAAPANQVWLYATGAVTVRRSPVQQPGDMNETFDRATNQVLMIAERGVMVAVDCVPPAAVLVDLAGEDA
jgi:hypothetical protein